MENLGDIPAGTTLYIPFNTYDSAGALVTASSLAASDFELYKDGSTTQRASDNGFTVTVDFDSTTGLHLLAIDLTDDSDSGFYSAGSQYVLHVGPFTVDSQTVGLSYRFRIVAAESVAGRQEVNVSHLGGSTTPVTNLNTVFNTDFADVYNTTHNKFTVYVDRISDVNSGDYAWMAVDFSSGAVTVTSGTPDFYTGVAGEVWGYDVSIFGASANQAGTKLKNALQPTTAGRTLDVTAAGNAGIDWGNVENPSTTLNLSGTTTNLVNTATTLTNAPSDSSGTTTLLSRVTAAVATATALATAQNDLDILTGSDGVTLATSQPNYAPATSAQATTIAGYLDTEIAAILAAVDTEVAAIKAKTDNLPASPAASGDIPSAATISTQVNSDLTTAHGAGSYQTATSVTVSDKTGFKLASDGLDSISTIAPAGVAANFREMLVQVWRRFFKKTTKSSTQIKTYADDGTTVVSTQTISSSGSDQTQGAAS